MALGFLEQSKLSEDLARQRNFFRKRQIARRILDFRFSILDWRTPGESYALVTRDQRSVNESFRRVRLRKISHSFEMRMFVEFHSEGSENSIPNPRTFIDSFCRFLYGNEHAQGHLVARE